MKNLITSEVVIAYAQCPLKAFLLLETSEQGEPHEYTVILEQEKQANQSRYIQSLVEQGKSVQPYTQELLEQGIDFLSNVRLRADGYEAECGLLTKAPGMSVLGNHYYEPTVFIGT